MQNNPKAQGRLVQGIAEVEPPGIQLATTNATPKDLQSKKVAILAQIDNREPAAKVTQERPSALRAGSPLEVLLFSEISFGGKGLL